METPTNMFSNEFDIEFISRMIPFEDITKTNMLSWLSNPRNFYYMDKDDIALFNFETPYLYTGHYFFNSRGKDAKAKAKSILLRFFDLFETPPVLRGLTPVEHKAAKWMNRQLGFKSQGQIETDLEEVCELFILTKKDLIDG